MRSKEDAADYRYFPDPDLVPVRVTREEIEAIKKTIPRMADERRTSYLATYQLTSYEAERLTEDKEMSDFFEEAVAHTSYPKTLVNLILTDVSPLFTEDTVEYPMNPVSLGVLADLLGNDEINSNTGRRLVKLLLKSDFDPKAYVEEHQLAQINDRSVLSPTIQDAITANARAVKDYLGGKETALRAIIGFVMKKTQGKANPLLVEAMIREAITE